METTQITVNGNSAAAKNGLSIKLSNFRPVTKEGSKVRAFCDATISLPGSLGKLTICGLSIVENGKGPWVSFPQRKGEKAWFDVIKAEGRIKELICADVLDRYIGEMSANSAGEITDDDIPF